MKVTLRIVRPDDVRLLWRWANDPDMRRWSYRPGRIPWSAHKQWFLRKLSVPDACRIYIATNGAGRRLGQARFDMIRVGIAEVDISVDRAFRGRGVGTLLLEAGCRNAARDLGLRRIVAHVMRLNEGSLRVFRKAGFRERRPILKHGVRSVPFDFRPVRSGKRR